MSRGSVSAAQHETMRRSVASLVFVGAQREQSCKKTRTLKVALTSVQVVDIAETKVVRRPTRHEVDETSVGVDGLDHVHDLGKGVERGLLIDCTINSMYC
jgi:hypothetical protein